VRRSGSGDSGLPGRVGPAELTLRFSTSRLSGSGLDERLLGGGSIHFGLGPDLRLRPLGLVDVAQETGLG
jgi:hypothetical protein